MTKLFFSYSHKDEELRNELEIHLTMLKRQNIIETWHDRRIDAGQEFNHEINNNLNQANIILLLISPYFLASDYCYNIELTKAIKMHEEGEAFVIPIILHPCDWQSAPFGKLKALPTDGKPISKFPNQHDAFLDITKEIRRVAEKFNSTPIHKENPYDTRQETPISNIQDKYLLRSSNLRIKKDFTDQDRDIFMEKTFEYISNFFEGSLLELEKRNQEINTKFKRIDANHFVSSIYKSGKHKSSCKIWLGSFHGSNTEIAYSSSISSSDNSMNDSISIQDDGQRLYLSALGHSFRNNVDGSKLTQEGAAEYFWEQLIYPLQY